MFVDRGMLIGRWMCVRADASLATLKMSPAVGYRLSTCNCFALRFKWSSHALVKARVDQVSSGTVAYPRCRSSVVTLIWHALWSASVFKVPECLCDPSIVLFHNKRCIRAQVLWLCCLASTFFFMLHSHPQSHSYCINSQTQIKMQHKLDPSGHARVPGMKWASTGDNDAFSTVMQWLHHRLDVS
jgi:hypothetical protein